MKRKIRRTGEIIDVITKRFIMQKVTDLII
jgi:hypothetical protein